MFTIAKFNDYLRAKKPTTIIFDDDNNGEYMRGYSRRTVCQPSYISIVFNKILIENKKAILQCNSGYIRLANIEKIQLDINGSLIGDIATLYCKNNCNLIAYTLVIR